jgi:putative membrane protein
MDISQLAYLLTHTRYAFCHSQVGGMERIRATPLPLVYVAHLRTFLLCYLLFMPLVYISHWQWGTIPAMALVSFALLGVEGAAAECESVQMATGSSPWLRTKSLPRASTARPSWVGEASCG